MRRGTTFLCSLLLALIFAGCGQYPERVDSARAIDRLPSTTEMIVVDGLPARDWAKLSQLRNLAHLRLSEGYASQVTDEHVRHLEVNGFPRLAQVSLANSKVGDEGLLHLSRIKSIQGLRLTGTQITDNGLAILSDRFENLEGINVEDCGRLTLQGLQRIGRSNTIDSVGFSVGTLSLSDIKRLVSENPSIRCWTIYDPTGRLTGADFSGIEESGGVRILIADKNHFVR